MEELDNISGKRGGTGSITADQRKENYGHPKELIDKLHTACSNVKGTLENMPRLVERLE